MFNYKTTPLPATASPESFSHLPPYYKSRPSQPTSPSGSSMYTQDSTARQRRLGDFSSLNFGYATSNSSRVQSPSTSTCTSFAPVEDVKHPGKHPERSLLGDFSRVFAHLGRTPPQTPRVPEEPASPTPRDGKATTAAQSSADPVNSEEPKAHEIVAIVQQMFLEDSSETSYQPIREYRLNRKTDNASVSGQTQTTGTKDSSSSEGSATYSTPRTTPETPSQRRASNARTTCVSAYQLYANGPVHTITEEDRCRACLPVSIPRLYGKVLQTDSEIHNKCPDLAENGIHIFLDMSNIHISFLNTIKEKLQLPAAARFPKNPHLNLRRLTKLVTRTRHASTLVAGCSVHPDRPEPAFVEELRKYDYRVDVRERKAVSPDHQTGVSPSKRHRSPRDIRYVEDLVDETLQTRIGETFMKSGHKKATLVLVTGDAKPAPYADGFYKCATRALDWGWNVEVVTWSTSCSSMWKELAAEEADDNRFRLINLDHYLKYLWTDAE